MRGNSGHNRFMHCKSSVWSPSIQTEDWETKEENRKRGKADFAFYIKTRRNGLLENKKEGIIRMGIDYSRCPKLIQIKRKYETWKGHSKDGLSLILGSRRGCGYCCIRMNFQNYKCIDVPYLRCGVQCYSEYFANVRCYGYNLVCALFPCLDDR
jgi:hypothetical protein